MSGQIVRAIDLSKVTTIEMQVSHERNDNYLLIRVSREYDLVSVILQRFRHSIPSNIDDQSN